MDNISYPIPELALKYQEIAEYLKIKGANTESNLTSDEIKKAASDKQSEKMIQTLSNIETMSTNIDHNVIQVGSDVINVKEIAIRMEEKLDHLIERDANTAELISNALKTTGSQFQLILELTKSIKEHPNLSDQFVNNIADLMNGSIISMKKELTDTMLENQNSLSSTIAQQISDKCDNLESIFVKFDHKNSDSIDSLMQNVKSIKESMSEQQQNMNSLAKSYHSFNQLQCQQYDQLFDKWKDLSQEQTEQFTKSMQEFNAKCDSIMSAVDKNDQSLENFLKLFQSEMDNFSGPQGLKEAIKDLVEKGIESTQQNIAVIQSSVKIANPTLSVEALSDIMKQAMKDEMLGMSLSLKEYGIILVDTHTIARQIHTDQGIQYNAINNILGTILDGRYRTPCWMVLLPAEKTYSNMHKRLFFTSISSVQ